MSLSEAIATEPAWLRAWIDVLIGVNLASLLFIVGKDAVGADVSRWRIRREPIAILAGFLLAATLMGWIHGRFGYVRLLGLAHVLCWGPVFAWIFFRRDRFEWRSLFGGYIHVYLLIAGISLVIDVVDVARYVAGDGALIGRWSGG